jgi:hypothetical protein
MPANPFRTPDYRWQRASYLCAHQQRTDHCWDDNLIMRARAFLLRLDRHDGVLDHPRLARLDPAILGAHRVRFNGDERFRWQLEARIVGEQPAAEIANRTGLSLDVVEAYEHLFYFVRDRLRSTDWVAMFIFGPRLYTGFSEDDVELIWKLYSYNFGYYFLELALATVYGVPSGVVIDDIEAATDFAASFRRAVALKAIPVTEKTAPLFLDLVQRLQEINREAEATRTDTVFGPVRVDPFDLTSMMGRVVRSADPGLVADGASREDGRCGTRANEPDADPIRQKAQRSADAVVDEFIARARKLA